MMSGQALARWNPGLWTVREGLRPPVRRLDGIEKQESVHLEAASRSNVVAAMFDATRPRHDTGLQQIAAGEERRWDWRLDSEALKRAEAGPQPVTSHPAVACSGPRCPLVPHRFGTPKPPKPPPSPHPTAGLKPHHPLKRCPCAPAAHHAAIQNVPMCPPRHCCSRFLESGSSSAFLLWYSCELGSPRPGCSTPERNVLSRSSSFYISPFLFCPPSLSLFSHRAAARSVPFSCTCYYPIAHDSPSLNHTAHSPLPEVTVLTGFFQPPRGIPYSSSFIIFSSLLAFIVRIFPALTDARLGTSL